MKKRSKENLVIKQSEFQGMLKSNTARDDKLAKLIASSCGVIRETNKKKKVKVTTRAESGEASKFYKVLSGSNLQNMSSVPIANPPPKIDVSMPVNMAQRLPMSPIKP